MTTNKTLLLGYMINNDIVTRITYVKTDTQLTYYLNSRDEITPIPKGSTILNTFELPHNNFHTWVSSDGLFKMCDDLSLHKKRSVK